MEQGGVSRVAFQGLMRAAAVSFLTDYAADADVKMQIYPGRPASLNPPTGFVDAIRETISYTALNQRVPSVDVIVVFGLFDSKEAVNQKDAFVDGLIDWSFDNVHEAHANTLVTITGTEDIPDFVPEWLPPATQRTYYATRITLEGLALSG